jgi:hypothetical protein
MCESAQMWQAGRRDWQEGIIRSGITLAARARSDRSDGRDHPIGANVR